MNPFPPPPPLPHIPTTSVSDNLLLASNLSNECHLLRTDLIQKAKANQEYQQYINELEDSIRDFGDEIDLKNELVEKLTKEIEALEKSVQDGEKQKAKQLSQIYKSHNEELDSLIHELMVSEKDNANLRSQLFQHEDELNGKDSLILDLRTQLRELEFRLNGVTTSDEKLSLGEEEEEIESKPDFEEVGLAVLSPNQENETKEIDPNDGLGNSRNKSLDSSPEYQPKTIRDNTKSYSKPSLTSLTGMMKKKFSESEDDEDISPNGNQTSVTIRRDLSNKYKRDHYNRIKTLGSFDSLYPKAVSFSSDPVKQKEKEKEKDFSWKNTKKHENMFQQIETNPDKSYFNWESGDSGPNTPDRPLHPLRKEKEKG
jgi:hypothetical protein